MVELVVATTNRGKIIELGNLLPCDIELLTLDDVGLPAPQETGQTFLDNARLKAEHASMSGIPAIADDSGLEVEGLDGAPGVHSARFAGSTATDEDNNRKLVALLADGRGASRSARFRCAVALSIPEAETISATGEVRGRIVLEPRGDQGFGYDPHFEICDEAVPDYRGLTMAELPPHHKNLISHRARAYRSLLDRLRSSPSADHPLISALTRIMTKNEGGGLAR